MAAVMYEEVPLVDGFAAEAYDRGEAAPRGGDGVFAGLRDHRLRAAVYFALWGAAGVVSTTTPTLAANADHVFFYFLLLVVGVLLLLLTVAAADLPWLERAAGRLEGHLRAMH